MLGSGVSSLLVGLCYVSYGYKWTQAMAVGMALIQALQLRLTQKGRTTQGELRKRDEAVNDGMAMSWGVRGFLLACFLYAPIVMQIGLFSKWYNPGWAGPSVLMYAAVPLFLKLQNTRNDFRYTFGMVALQSLSTLAIPLNPVLALVSRIPASYSLFSLQNQTQIVAAEKSGAKGVSAYNLGLMSGGVLGAGWFGWVTDNVGLTEACILMTVTGGLYGFYLQKQSGINDREKTVFSRCKTRSRSPKFDKSKLLN